MMLATLLSIATAGADSPATACDLLPMERDGMTGYVDHSGQMVLPARFDYAERFNEGLAAARSGKAMGYIDCTGAWAISPKFSWTQGCQEGWCRAADPNQQHYFLVDRAGKELRVESLPTLYLPHEGIAVGMAEFNSYGFVDVQTRRVVGPRFADAQSEFAEGLLGACEKSQRCGYVDRRGAWVVPPVYAGVANFSEGLAHVWLKDESFYIDHQGRRAFTTVLKGGSDFHDGIAGASVDGTHWGILGRQGHFLVAPRFESIGEHRNGRLVYEQGRRLGVLDYSGHVILEAAFDRADLLPDGIVDVHLGAEHGYYDRDGRPIVPIRSLDAYRDIKRISLIAVYGHTACNMFRVDLRADDTATFTAVCESKRRSPGASIEPMAEPGRYTANRTFGAFATLAKFAADNDLVHYDGSHTAYGLDTSYDAIEIETSAGTRSIDVAESISPALRMFDWSIRQAVRELQWRKE